MVGEEVVRFYNQWGAAEQWIKEGKYALNWMMAISQWNSNGLRVMMASCRLGKESLEAFSDLWSNTGILTSSGELQAGYLGNPGQKESLCTSNLEARG